MGVLAIDDGVAAGVPPAADGRPRVAEGLIISTLAGLPMAPTAYGLPPPGGLVRELACWCA